MFNLKNNSTMEWWDKMVFPMHRVWSRLARRLRIHKTGLVKLRQDVRTCDYEDVHVLWDMLKKNDTELARSPAGRKKGRLWNIVNWAKRAPFLCRSF